ncbi:[FeFe] hydrogenase H-cluster radical SAM maturase HydG [Myxococcota bacterium]|nr:[FeFe] hydrogenase H-cluster radical SAM maturase HydG [Myxococcota bacterium]MBU1429307.1 [FeFe] hydrogenase H-cluster radical SAM maturase HydG [Myxococcota bacterium]MBU1899307.1 [FeFe] hydrogenase H-cluster radical SAM maturase HydG [Myxococcota bacterium]
MKLPRALSPSAHDFINEDQIHALCALPEPSDLRLDEILARAASKTPLKMEEAAVLLAASSPHQRQRVAAAARALKDAVYGNRVVLFAPLYVGNLCRNDCHYCAFRRSNKEAVRATLNPDELEAQVKALIRGGHKRLILVFGEHPRYDAEFIAEAVQRVYQIREGNGEIRRVNINAAPLDEAGYRRVHEAGIGTYQVFQETYHHATYAQVHPGNTPKSDYHWRLDSATRAIQSGCDDVGIGALFGLYDWRFETLALVKHADVLNTTLGVGPHTISFPRIQRASGVDGHFEHAVSDEDFKHLVAVLRLAVPYTGLILTARERPEIRREVMALGVSQIDAGTRIEIGGYTAEGAQRLEREQFEVGDTRPLDEVMAELLEDGYLPSFCTACYRLGRVGEHFMSFAQPGFIKRFCGPNALFTLAEYLEDYATPRTKAAGHALIQAELALMKTGREAAEARLAQIIQGGARDLYV